MTTTTTTTTATAVAAAAMDREERAMKLEDVLVMHLKRKRHDSLCKRGSEDGFKRIEAQLREAKRVRLDDRPRSHGVALSLAVKLPSSSSSTAVAPSSSSSTARSAQVSRMHHRHHQEKIPLPSDEDERRIHQQHYQLRLRQQKVLAHLHQQRKRMQAQPSSTEQPTSGRSADRAVTTSVIRATHGPSRSPHAAVVCQRQRRCAAHAQATSHQSCRKEHQHKHVCVRHQHLKNASIASCPVGHLRSPSSLGQRSSLDTKKADVTTGSLPASRSSTLLPPPSSLLALSYPLVRSTTEHLSFPQDRWTPIDPLSPSRCAVTSAADVRLPPLLALLNE